MRIAIIQFPGSNCESESIRAIREAGMEPVEFLWNQNPAELKNFDGFFIVGGFSYEDRSRSGIISALDPIMKYIKQESETGKPVLGICNGAQILVETGLVPGLQNNQLGMALAVNRRVQNGKVLGTGFYNTWVNVKSSSPQGSSAFNKNLKENEFINIPIAHGEGRFVIPEALLEEMKANNQTVYRYCDNEGNTSEEFPVNPNGSVYSLAAVTNTAGNIMAMMPHPERTPNGQPIFTSVRDYIKENKTIDLAPLTYTPPTQTLKTFTTEPNNLEILVELKITDNEAKTVHSTLSNLNIKAEIKKFTHWEIIGDNLQEIKDKIIESGELFNSNKEKIVIKPIAQENSVLFLIRYKDDFVGLSKVNTLTSRFNIKGLKKINKGIIWQISAPSGNIQEVTKYILDSHILFNQFSEDCFILNPESATADEGSFEG